jgi:DUF3079 family protein
MKNVPLRPTHPERTCWGCDKYCPAADLGCGNGTIRTMHPIELFGDDWLDWSEQRNQLRSAGDPRDAGAACENSAVPARQS